MAKFKVGDEVRIIALNGFEHQTNYKIGHVGKITVIAGDGDFRVGPEELCNWYSSKEVELVKSSSKKGTKKMSKIEIVQPREFKVKNDIEHIDIRYCETFNVTVIGFSNRESSISEFDDLENFSRHIELLRKAEKHLYELRDGKKKKATKKRKPGRPRKVK